MCYYTCRNCHSCLRNNSGEYCLYHSKFLNNISSCEKRNILLTR